MSNWCSTQKVVEFFSAAPVYASPVHAGYLLKNSKLETLLMNCTHYSSVVYFQELKHASHDSLVSVEHPVPRPMDLDQAMAQVDTSRPVWPDGKFQDPGRTDSAGSASAAASGDSHYPGGDALNFIVPFGKHRGKKVRDIPMEYAEWCLGREDEEAWLHKFPGMKAALLAKVVGSVTK